MIEETQKWLDKDRRYIWHGMAGYNPDASPMVVTEADGAWIMDSDGNRYLDGMAGMWSVNAGYGREELAQAAYEQLKTMSYYPITQSHLPAIELGEKLNEWLDDEYVIRYANSGSEANETAFKIARQYHAQNGEPGRYKFIARYRAYHGNTMGALAATGQSQRKYLYEPLAPGFLHVVPPDRYRCAFCSDRPACNLECAREVERVITWELLDTVAGVIMEAIITGGGIIVPPDGYVEEVARICERNGVLLIIDEVGCGFGRTGKKFGYQHYDVKPDIVTVGKAITSGYLPLSAAAVRREVFEKFKGTEEYGRFRQVNTFSGNPAACAVAVKNLEIMEDEDLCGRSAALGERLREGLTELKNHPNVGDIRGKGLLVGIELVEDKESKQPVSTHVMDKVISACNERGFILRYNRDTTPGVNNILVMAPPLSITDEDLAFIVEALKGSFEQL
ncbi:MAG TPA: aspartate aminotransferase family protein [Rubrobacteraceae bacterium]|jgi:adenosylmethionine-8-amino-7-oxononanoate aminotransferase|nr:aspartate aminotransferase family protein [Rubrobacteraceae bacterium]